MHQGQERVHDRMDNTNTMVPLLSYIGSDDCMKSAVVDMIKAEGKMTAEVAGAIQESFLRNASKQTNTIPEGWQNVPHDHNPITHHHLPLQNRASRALLTLGDSQDLAPWRKEPPGRS